MIRAQFKFASIQVRPEVLDCLDGGQQLSSGNTIVSFRWGESLAVIGNYSLLSLLYL